MKPTMDANQVMNLVRGEEVAEQAAIRALKGIFGATPKMGRRAGETGCTELLLSRK